MQQDDMQLRITENLLNTYILTGNAEMVQTILNTDICPRIISNMICKAIDYENFEIVRLLLSYVKDVEMLYYRDLRLLYNASCRGYTDIVKMLIDKKANLNKRTNGCTALYASICNNHFETSKLLILKGANLNIETIVRDTPLHAATRNEQEEIVQLLLDHDALIDKKDRFDQTALYCSVMNIKHNVLKVLLQNRADVNILCKGKTVLHHAICRNRIVQILLSNGADINALNDMKKTPLYCAVDDVGIESIETVKLLLRRGADPNIGISPLRVAMMSNEKDKVQVLLEYGCETSHVTANDLHNTSDEIQKLFEDYFEFFRERDVAFMMASHRTLGRYSPLKNFDDNILRMMLPPAPKLHP